MFTDLMSDYQCYFNKERYVIRLFRRLYELPEGNFLNGLNIFY